MLLDFSLSQVLPYWKGYRSLTLDLASFEGLRELRATRAEVRHGLDALFAQELEDDLATRQKKKRATGDKPESNRLLVLALGSQFQCMRGHGLVAFYPEQRLEPLAVGEERVFVAAPNLVTGAMEQRSVIVSTTGARRWELPRKYVKGKLCMPAWHQCADMCAGSWHGPSTLVHSVGLRSTLNFDRFHRVSGDVELASTHAALQYVATQWRAVVDFRSGPFKGSGNYWLFKECAKEFFAVADKDNHISQFLYNDISRDLGEDCAWDFGTEQHQHRLWREVRELLAPRSNEGGVTKRGRWWSVQSKGRACGKLLSSWLLVLVYTGWKKKALVEEMERLPSCAYA